MERFTGLIGIIVILGIAYLISNNRKAINYRLIVSGIGLQLLIAVLVLKVSFITNFFAWIGKGMGKIEQFATQGAAFAYGGIMVDTHDGASRGFGAPHTFVFAFSVTATIIFVCVIVAILYHIGFMQKVIAVIARAMNFVMRVSGAEALSNIASALLARLKRR
jgi:concentrative nucleoside transporter, CNT family